MTDRELMQQALDALDEDNYMSSTQWKALCRKTCTALRARLAQPEPEELAALEEAMIEAWKIIPADEEQLKRIAKLVGQEPVAQVQVAEDYHAHVIWTEGVNPVDLDQKFLYTAPPQREWQGLTDEEIKQLWKDTPQLVGVYSYTDIAREVEAKLKEKNT